MNSFYIRTFATLPSTNDELRKSIGKAPEWTAILSSKQTKGRGRRENLWASSSGGLYLSVLFYPLHTDRLQLLTFAAALSVIKTIKANYPSLSPSIKWPNDILIGGKKVCGILTETTFSSTPASIVGIGLNVNQKRFPRSLHATSLLIESKAKQDITLLSLDILSSFQYYYFLFSSREYPSILDEWKKNCSTLGREIRIISP